MDDLYTILWDPRSIGQFQFFDRIFYTEPKVALSRLDDLNRNSIFPRYFLYKVSFHPYKINI